MAKLIQLAEAAELLGVSPEKLTELRSQNKIFGYRDGSTWKFKESELERYAAQEGIVLGAGPAPADDDVMSLTLDADGSASSPAVDAELDEMIDVEDESVLVSEEELGASDPGASSTIIGKDELSDESDLKLAVSDSEIRLDAPGDSELDLGSLSGGSELQLAADSAVPLTEKSEDDAGSSLQLEGSSFEFDFEASGSDLLSADTGKSDSPSDTGDLPGGDGHDLILDGDSLGMDDALELGDDELLLESDSVSNISLDDSEIDLDLASGTDDSLLSDGSGSDVTLNASDSGINLAKPSESGISLETIPSELGGSDMEALELGEAEIIDLDDVEVDLDAATQLKADDDFLLSPVEGALGEEADSGSQVIALDAEEFDEGADTILGDPLGAPVVVDEEFGSLPESRAPAMVAPAGAGAGMVAGEAVEAPYSLWNVVGLALCVLLMAMVGIMCVDLLRNMWSWEQPYTLNSWLMDTILSAFGSSR
ncbi:MAG: helix-turn-helix domain-containing protein [Planctomycetales bacterium]|nr:helix-turn-helix domain-containing protein [Planctomycetales bacterium]